MNFTKLIVQDTIKDTLKVGEEITVWVTDLLRCATGRDGGTIWKNFRRRVTCGSVNDFLMRRGIVIHQRRILGCRTKLPAVNLSDVIVFLSVVLDKDEAKAALQSPGLLEALVLHGMAPDVVQTAIAEALSTIEPDVATITQLNTLFGRMTIVRFQKITVMAASFTVFSAVDLVTVALDCNKNVAQKIIYKLFKDYHTIDLEKVDTDTLASPQAYPYQHFPGPTNGVQLHRVHFQTERGTNATSTSLALNLADTLELLVLIPGSELSAQVRRKAVDTLIRVQGGDVSLINEILEKRALQDYLSEHDPENPMRAAGEYVEQKAAGRATEEVAHRRRMNDLEVQRQGRMDVAAALVLFNREEDERLVLRDRNEAARLVLHKQNEAAAVALLLENAAKISLLNATAAAANASQTPSQSAGGVWSRMSQRSSRILAALSTGFARVEVSNWVLQR